MCITEELNNVLKTNPDASLLYGAAKSVWEGSLSSITIHIPILKKLKTKMKEYGISDLTSLFITDSDIRHIRNKHSSGEEKRGQINIEPSDFALLNIVINDFDECLQLEQDRLGNSKFKFIKRCRSTWYIVTVQRGKPKLEILSMWKRRK